MSVFLKSWQWQIFRSICENGRAYSFIHFSTIDCSNQSGSRPFASQRHSPTPPREKKKKKKSGAGGFLISGDLASGLRWADIFANEWAAGLRRGEQIKKKTCQKLAIGTTAANIKKKKRKKKRNLSSITSCSSTGKTLPGLSTLCRSNTMTPSLHTYCICTTLKASMAADQKQQRQCLTFM